MKLNHLAIPYLALVAFLFGGFATSEGISWYETLVLPSWHPSAEIIALIWALIYVGIAWSLIILWNTTPHDRGLRSIIGGFTTVTLINLIWSVVFFLLHSFLLSVICAVVLGVVVLGLSVVVVRRSVMAGLLLIPYILWVFFAAYLNYVVMLMN